MTVFYLDTSIAFRALFGDPPQVAAWFDEVSDRPGDSLVSSRLLRLELTRVLRRESLPVTKRAEVLDKVDLLALDESVLASAEAIEPHIRSLDSIHLATAVVSGLYPTVATHDGRMKEVARHLGLEVTDPVEYR